MLNNTGNTLLALALAGVNWERVQLSFNPLVCRDTAELPEYHHHKNGCSWSIVDKASGIVERSGRVTKALRVTEFKAGQQQVLPFGGDFNSPEEDLYQFNRWDMFDGRG